MDGDGAASADDMLSKWLMHLPDDCPPAVPAGVVPGDAARERDAALAISAALRLVAALPGGADDVARFAAEVGGLEPAARSAAAFVIIETMPWAPDEDAAAHACAVSALLACSCDSTIPMVHGGCALWSAKRRGMGPETAALESLAAGGGAGEATSSGPMRVSSDGLGMGVLHASSFGLPATAVAELSLCLGRLAAGLDPGVEVVHTKGDAGCLGPGASGEIASPADAATPAASDVPTASPAGGGGGGGASAAASPAPIPEPVLDAVDAALSEHWMPDCGGTVRALLQAWPGLAGRKLSDKGRASTLLHCACARGSPGAVTALLAAGADPAGASNHRRQTPSHCAALASGHGDAVACLELLSRAGAPTDAPDSKGRTPLWEAAMDASAVVAAWLLERGADPNVVAGGKRKRLPLLLAVVERFATGKGDDGQAAAMCRLLLRHGATLVPLSSRAEALGSGRARAGGAGSVDSGNGADSDSSGPKTPKPGLAHSPQDVSRWTALAEAAVVACPPEMSALLAGARATE